MHLIKPENLFRNTFQQVQFKVESCLDGRKRLVLLDKIEFNIQQFLSLIQLLVFWAYRGPM